MLKLLLGQRALLVFPRLRRERSLLISMTGSLVISSLIYSPKLYIFQIPLTLANHEKMEMA